jgi:hypothetical protein
MDMLSIPNHGAREASAILAFATALPGSVFRGVLAGVPVIPLVHVPVGVVVVGNQPTG